MRLHGSPDRAAGEPTGVEEAPQVFPLVDERVEWKALLETNACHSVIVI